MPFRYDILEDPRYVRIQATGRLCAEEYFACFGKCIEEEAFHPSIPILFEIGDEAKLSIDRLESEKVDKLVSMVQEARGDAQYRVAMAGGPLDTRAFFFMAQEIANEKPKRLSFASVPEALEWLFPGGPSVSGDLAGSSSRERRRGKKG